MTSALFLSSVAKIATQIPIEFLLFIRTFVEIAPAVAALESGMASDTADARVTKGQEVQVVEKLRKGNGRRKRYRRRTGKVGILPRQCCTKCMS